MKLPPDIPAATGRPFIDLAREIAVAILRTIEAGWALAMESPDAKGNTQEIAITEGSIRVTYALLSASWRGSAEIFLNLLK